LICGAERIDKIPQEYGEDREYISDDEQMLLHYNWTA
jgi:hypothetical protein